ncbi:MAG: 2'-5' RNA ligase family protein [Syntrophobacter sp.]
MKRYLILGLPDDRLAAGIRERQRALSSLSGDDLALRFPVHITLRGPFWGHDSPMRQFCGDLPGLCRGFSPVPVDLAGPVFVPPDLCWFEVQRDASRFAELLRLHALLEDETHRCVVVDDVSTRFKAEGFRPHATLGWKSPASLAGVEQACGPQGTRLHGRLESVAVAVYPHGWPSEGSVAVIQTVPLACTEEAPERL